MVSDFDRLWSRLSAKERRELEALLDQLDTGWAPQDGPQTMAYESKADIIGYGGAAGGGKTALLCGLALAPWHKQIEIIRKEAKQTKSIRNEINFILLNSKKSFKNPKNDDLIWGSKVITFSSMKDPDSHEKGQGQAKDFKAFDEVTAIPKYQVDYSLRWLRSVDKSVKCQALMTFNPPMNRDSSWVIDYFAPWIDKRVPYGEPLIVATINGRDTFLDRKDPFVVVGDELIYDFDPTEFTEEQIIRPMSRTFIFAKVTDNKYLVKTNYLSVLQSIPDENLKKALLEGDMRAMLQDGVNQLFKTQYIEEAFARYDALKNKDQLKMVQLGVDVARGGADKTSLCPRYENNIFGEIKTYQGRETSTGLQVADIVLKNRKNNAIICMDTIGIGSSPFDMLTQHYNLKAYQDVIPVTVSVKSRKTWNNVQRIRNLRDELHFNLAYMLDPQNGFNIAIKRDHDLLRELEAVERFCDDSMVASVSSRQDMVDKLGRSPDKLTSLLLSAMTVYDLRNYSVGRIDNPLEKYRR